MERFHSYDSLLASCPQCGLRRRALAKFFFTWLDGNSQMCVASGQYQVVIVEFLGIFVMTEFKPRIFVLYS